MPGPRSVGSAAAWLPLPVVPSVVPSSLALLALVLSVAALALAVVANRRYLASRRPTGARAQTGPSTPDTALAEALRGRVDLLGEQVAGLRESIAREASAPRDPTALRHVALVRYDAFADVGGRLSYSVAVLDDTRSGLVLTTLSGKSDVRTYVRTVCAGSGAGTLTAEEQQAVDAALPPPGPGGADPERGSST